MESPQPRLVPCVGAVVRDPTGRLLLVRRGHAPQAGRWSLPGGHIEAGESPQEALVREVWEETGYLVAVGEAVGEIVLPGPPDERFGRADYQVVDYACAVTGGDLAAGDDAADARWVHPDEMDRLPLTTDLLELLREWGVLPD